MTQYNPEPLYELDNALVECLRILARRGRSLREAKEKEAANQTCSHVENNFDLTVDTPSSKAKVPDDNFITVAHSPGDQQPQAAV